MNTYLSEKGLTILLFHGVIDEGAVYAVRNYTRKHISEKAFIHCLHEIKKDGVPLSMNDIVSLYLKKEKYPPRSFAITFDDGFANNYSIAAPILREFNIPATFYVTTDFVENNTMSWIDRIEYCFEWQQRVELTLPWGETVLCETNGDKMRALESIRFHVKRDPTIKLDEFVEEIFRQCEMMPIYHSDGPLDKKMTWEQVRDLAREELFIVGGHSHDHVNLAFLEHEECAQQISKSLQYITEKTGLPMKHYSYPEGLENCYSEKVISLLKDHGVVCSPTAIEGVNTQQEDLFHLRRTMVDTVCVA